MGIEPTPEAWEAAVLPLNYARVSTYSNQLSAQPFGRPPRGCICLGGPALEYTALCVAVASLGSNGFRAQLHLLRDLIDRPVRDLFPALVGDRL